MNEKVGHSEIEKGTESTKTKVLMKKQELSSSLNFRAEFIYKFFIAVHAILTLHPACINKKPNSLTVVLSAEIIHFIYWLLFSE